MEQEDFGKFKSPSEQLKLPEKKSGGPNSFEELSASLTREDNKMLLGRFKSFEKNAKEMGVDISRAMKYLETGEGDSSLVKEALSELARKEAEEIEKEAGERGLISSEGESKRILLKVMSKYNQFLTELEMLEEKRGNILDKLGAIKGRSEKNRLFAERANPPQQERAEDTLAQDLAKLPKEIERETLRKQELGIRDIKVKEAKEQFQNETRDLLEEKYILWSEISKLGASKQDEVEKIQKIQQITKIDEQLMERAKELTEEENYKEYVVTWREVFDPEENWEWQRPDEGTGEGNREIPVARKAFLELRDSLKEIILEKTGLFDEVTLLSKEVSSCADLLFEMENLSPAQKSEYEEKIQTNNSKIKEAEIRVKEINGKIEEEREKIAKKYGIDKKEIEFDFHLGEFGREPYSSV